MAKTKRSRAQRREGERAALKLKRELLRVDALLEGGNPKKPIVVPSASVVETLALGRTCPVCEGTLDLVEHQARVIEGLSQRVAITRCRICGTETERFFVLQEHVAN